MLIILFAAACTSEPEPTRPNESAESWIYIQTTVATPEGRTSYLQLRKDLDFALLDLSEAVELPGNARVFSDGRRLFTGSGEEPVIQQWFPRNDGTLEPSERLSFANAGLTTIPFGNNFVANDKAYLFDGSVPAAFVWDPESVTVKDSIDLSPIVKENLTPAIDPGVLRDGLLFAAVQQYDFATNQLFRGIQVVVIDTTTDTIQTVLEDDRCVGTFAGITQDDDGSIYVLGDNYLVLHWFDDTIPPTCVLRIPPGETAFDAGPELDLVALTGHPSTGFIVSEGKAYTQAMDESQGTIDPAVEPLAFLNQPVAIRWEIDLQDPSRSRPLVELGLASPRSGNVLLVDGRTFLQAAEEAFAGRTQIYEVLEDGSFVERFEVTGLVTAFGRIDSSP
ncbi:MAG: hypothetical protein AAGA48_02580 [Myxococcota bacterium]